MVDKLRKAGFGFSRNKEVDVESEHYLLSTARETVNLSVKVRDSAVSYATCDVVD